MDDLGIFTGWNKQIYTLISFIIIILLRISLVRIIKNFTKKFHRFETRTTLIVKYVNYFSIFLFIISLFSIWGINVKDLGLFMSSIFAVIGIAFFAQWSILSNVTSGVVMFFTFPYKIGDFIKIHDGDHSVYGYIEEIRSFHVLLKTVDEETITFPNSLLLQKGVSIFTEENIRKYLEEERRRQETNQETNQVRSSLR